MIGKRLRPIGLCAVLTAPALVLRFSGAEPGAVAGLLLFGLAVVAASRVRDRPVLRLYGGLESEYVAYAAANMTGSNRLLLGLGNSVSSRARHRSRTT